MSLPNRSLLALLLAVVATGTAKASVIIDMPPAPTTYESRASAGATEAVDPGRLALDRFAFARGLPSVTSTGWSGGWGWGNAFGFASVATWPPGWGYGWRGWGGSGWGGWGWGGWGLGFPGWRSSALGFARPAASSPPSFRVSPAR